jgi:hypothetical protein
MTVSFHDDRARVNSRELKLTVISPPMKDGTTHLLEVTSDPANEYQQKLFVSELKGFLGGMLPSGFELIIYRPEARTPGLDFLSFQNLTKGRRINFSVRIYFQDWSYRTNLLHFAEELRLTAEQQISNCQTVSITKDEYGVTLSCAVLLEPGDDCYDVYTSTDHALSRLYKEVVSKVDQRFISKLEASSAPADAGFRWWIRYVLVPIISGGAGAAVIGWLMLHIFN